MPHKRDQTKLLTTPQQEVKRCGTSTTKKKNEKITKSLCANFNEELQASSEEFNKHITTKKKTTMCTTSPNPTTRVAKTRNTST